MDEGRGLQLVYTRFSGRDETILPNFRRAYRRYVCIYIERFNGTSSWQYARKKG